MAMKKYGGIEYDSDVDYKAKENDALNSGDMLGARKYETQRNAKIDGEGLSSFDKTNNYGTYKDDGTMKIPEEGMAIDYSSLKNDAIKAGDYRAAAEYEKNHNDKNNTLGLGYPNTYEYGYFAKGPEFKSAYGREMSGLFSDIKNSDFNFNAKTNPLYKQVLAQTEREATRQTEDTLGKYAGMTGGIPSSYAVSAAAQAGAYEREKGQDRLMDVYNQEYNRYLAKLQNKKDQYSMLADRDNTDYSRFANERNFAYDAADRRADTARWKDETDYNRERDATADARYADETAYNRGRDAEADRRYEEEKGYNRGRDEVADDRYNTEYADSREDTEWQKDQQSKEAAQKKMWDTVDRYIALGDWEGLKAYGEEIGMKFSGNVGFPQKLDAAIAAASNGVTAPLYSLLGELGLPTTGTAVGSGNVSAPTLSGESGMQSERNKVYKQTAPGKYEKDNSAGNEELEVDSDTIDRADRILKDAASNGKVVNDKNDWDFLIVLYGEDALEKNGFTFNGGTDEVE